MQTPMHMIKERCWFLPKSTSLLSNFHIGTMFSFFQVNFMSPCFFLMVVEMKSSPLTRRQNPLTQTCRHTAPPAQMELLPSPPQDAVRRGTWNALAALHASMALQRLSQAASALLCKRRHCLRPVPWPMRTRTRLAISHKLETWGWVTVDALDHGVSDGWVALSSSIAVLSAQLTQCAATRVCTALVKPNPPMDNGTCAHISNNSQHAWVSWTWGTLWNNSACSMFFFSKYSWTKTG